MERELWGMAFVMSPLVLLVVFITIAGFQADSKKPQSESWVIKVVPLIFIVPFVIHLIIVMYCTPWAILQGIILGVFLYGFSFLLILFVWGLKTEKSEK